MSEWKIASGAVTFFILVSGFIFGWGWKIVKDIERGINKKIDTLKEEKVATHEELYNLIRRNAENISERASMRYVDQTFTRKDTHSLEFQQIMTEIRTMKETLNDVLRKVLGGRSDA